MSQGTKECCTPEWRHSDRASARTRPLPAVWASHKWVLINTGAAVVSNRAQLS